MQTTPGMVESVPEPNQLIRLAWENALRICSVRQEWAGGIGRTGALGFVVLLALSGVSPASAGNRHALVGGCMVESASTSLPLLCPLPAVRFLGFTLPPVTRGENRAPISATDGRFGHQEPVAIPQARLEATRSLVRTRQKPGKEELLPVTFSTLWGAANSKRAAGRPNGAVGRAPLRPPSSTGPPPVRAGPARPYRVPRPTPPSVAFEDVIFIYNPFGVACFYVNSPALQRSTQPSKAARGDGCAAHGRAVSAGIVDRPEFLVSLVRGQRCHYCLWNDTRQRKG